MNSIVGAGIVGIPFAIARSGFFSGLFLLIFVAFLVDYGVRLLVKCGKEVGKNTYEDVCEHVYGKKGFYCVSVCMSIFAYGSMVAYLIIIGDTIPPIAEHAGITIFSNRNDLILFVAIFFILPLCLLRDMSSLAWSSLLSILADAILIALVVIAAPQAAIDTNIDTSASPYTFIEPTVFAGIASMSFAFICHHSCFFVHSSMSNPTVKRWNTVTHLSITVALLACSILGFSGYLNFRNEVEGDVLNNFPTVSVVPNIARALLALTMILTYPMEMFVVRHALHSILVRRTQPTVAPMSQTRHIVITLALWGTSVFLSLCFENLGLVLELTGAIGASMLGYILPSLIFFSLRSSQWKHVKLKWKRCSSEYEPNFHKRWQITTPFILPLIMTGFGFIVLVVGTISAFMD